MLEGLRSLLAPHYEIVGAVDDGRTLVATAVDLKPDLIVLDISMPLMNGIDAGRLIRAKLPATKLVFLTMHASPAYLEAALSAGGTGYVLKSAARGEILTAINRVLDGHVFVTRAMGSEVSERCRDTDAAHAAKTLRLTPREREILQLIAEGRTSKEAAYILKVAPKTIAFHRDNMKNKLGLRSTAKLTEYAIQEGII
jgi:DNA-binding NarL/FixJ family response regulator